MLENETSEEREAFIHMEELAIARASIRELDGRLSNVEKTHKQIRNETLDEVAAEIERLAIAFGVDTVHSFMVLVRSMKE